jgi:hypothetical protein
MYHSCDCVISLREDVCTSKTSINVVLVFSMCWGILVFMAVLEIKIWIYWSESNSWIYFYIVLKKNVLVKTKFHWSWAGEQVLIVRTAMVWVHWSWAGEQVLILRTAMVWVHWSWAREQVLIVRTAMVWRTRIWTHQMLNSVKSKITEKYPRIIFNMIL